MAFTTLPALLSGDIPSSAEWQTLKTGITELRPPFARKTADETVNGSAALQDDNELIVGAAADATYLLELQATQNSGATPGFKLSFSLPSGATWLHGRFNAGSSAANEQFGLMPLVGLSGITGAAADSLLVVRALITISSTAGNVTLQWAQNTSNASNTVVRSGSWLLLTRVA